MLWALQERLFEELIPLISSAATCEEAADGGNVLRALACKVEQIHTTLRKHLRKEEEQLLPLLLANFTTSEQVCDRPRKPVTCCRQSALSCRVGCPPLVQPACRAQSVNAVNNADRRRSR